MERGLSLYDIGGRLHWSSLMCFVRHAGPDTAYARAVHGTRAMWAASQGATAILARLTDQLAYITNIMLTEPGSQIDPIEPYPRPWDGERRDRSERMTREQFDEWMEGLKNG